MKLRLGLALLLGVVVVCSAALAVSNMGFMITYELFAADGGQTSASKRLWIAADNPLSVTTSALN